MRAADLARIGLEKSVERFDRTADRISKGAPGETTIQDIVDIGLEKHVFQANVKVIKAEDEMTESLIHIIA